MANVFRYAYVNVCCCACECFRRRVIRPHSGRPGTHSDHAANDTEAWKNRYNRERENGGTDTAASTGDEHVVDDFDDEDDDGEPWGQINGETNGRTDGRAIHVMRPTYTGTSMTKKTMTTIRRLVCR